MRAGGIKDFEMFNKIVSVWKCGVHKILIHRVNILQIHIPCTIHLVVTSIAVWVIMVGVVVTAVVMTTVVVVVVAKVLVWAGAVISMVVEVLVFGVRGIIVVIAILDDVEIILAEVAVNVFIDVSADIIIGIVLGIGVEVLTGVDVNSCAAVVTASLEFPMATVLGEFSTWAACNCWPPDFCNCDRVLQDCMPLYHVW